MAKKLSVILLHDTEQTYLLTQDFHPTRDIFIFILVFLL